MIFQILCASIFEMINGFNITLQLHNNEWFKGKHMKECD